VVAVVVVAAVVAVVVTVVVATGKSAACKEPGDQAHAK
jgi:hypothetical protein